MAFILESLIADTKLPRHGRDYLSSVLQEIQEKQLKTTIKIAENDFYQRLESLDRSKCILIECRNKLERFLIHSWADHHQLNSKASIYSEFPESYLYRCLECNSREENMKWHKEYVMSFLRTREYYGSYIKCRACDNVVYRDCDKEEQDEAFQKTLHFNCVVITNNLERTKIKKPLKLEKLPNKINSTMFERSVQVDDLNELQTKLLY